VSKTCQCLAGSRSIHDTGFGFPLRFLLARAPAILRPQQVRNVRSQADDDFIKL
jgi:hypothetical protein